jgi:hypothetical protein
MTSSSNRFLDRFSLLLLKPMCKWMQMLLNSCGAIRYPVRAPWHVRKEHVFSIPVKEIGKRFPPWSRKRRSLTDRLAERLDEQFIDGIQ